MPHAPQVLNEQSYPVALRLIRKNLFRTLPPSRRASADDSDDDEDEDEDGGSHQQGGAGAKVEEAGWPHRELIYQFGTRSVRCLFVCPGLHPTLYTGSAPPDVSCLLTGVCPDLAIIILSHSGNQNETKRNATQGLCEPRCAVRCG
eukprot:SAG22_NODE_77_length_22125_cov_46.140016_10_plen_146_part_00